MLNMFSRVRDRLERYKAKRIFRSALTQGEWEFQLRIFYQDIAYNPELKCYQFIECIEVEAE